MFHGMRHLEALVEEVQAEHALTMKRPSRSGRVPRHRRRPQTAIIARAAAEIAWRRAAINHALRLWRVV
jgi:hypothetical protein